ncbi:hypothetical protein MFU01_47930 [Myxococcus fulvus]|uniref:Uncharacterized protein n=1 Tax=Myxococcus fulvus TaxID=33 RepID=A0A511T6G4_MYXFU|nr:hypothetical protein MFU01_47930 [Myxococcus fulvus]
MFQLQLQPRLVSGLERLQRAQPRQRRLRSHRPITLCQVTHEGGVYTRFAPAPPSLGPHPETTKAPTRLRG